MTTSVAEVIGSNARAIRKDADLTLDHIAQAARLSGLPWTSGRVGDLESGRVTDSLSTLYALALALHRATGRPVRLFDLLAGEGRVQLNRELTVELAELRNSVSGRPVTVGETEDSRRLTDLADKMSRAGITRLEEWKRLPKPVRRNLDPLVWLQVERTLREADVRMCKSLGVDRDLAAAVMVKLWDKSFSDERDARTEPGANAQRKGQISRQLKAQLEKAIQ